MLKLIIYFDTEEKSVEPIKNHRIIILKNKLLNSLCIQEVT